MSLIVQHILTLSTLIFDYLLSGVDVGFGGTVIETVVVGSFWTMVVVFGGTVIEAAVVGGFWAMVVEVSSEMVNVYLGSIEQRFNIQRIELNLEVIQMLRTVTRFTDRSVNIPSSLPMLTVELRV